MVHGSKAVNKKESLDYATRDQAISTYSLISEAYLERYESVRFEDVHANILDLVPSSRTRVLDVGAGSGRDSAALAKMGHDVVAVEPCLAMRKGAQSLHTDVKILWLDDALPNLAKVKTLGLKFGFILLSAVWMHLPSALRRDALESLVNLLEINGRLAITLRIGEPDPDRVIFSVNTEELEQLAKEFGLAIIRISCNEDRLKRHDVKWITLVLQK